MDTLQVHYKRKLLDPIDDASDIHATLPEEGLDALDPCVVLLYWSEGRL